MRRNILEVYRLFCYDLKEKKKRTKESKSERERIVREKREREKTSGYNGTKLL